MSKDMGCTWNVTKIDKEEAIKEFGLTYTGELVTVDYCGGATCTYRVIKHKFTPFGFMRDCGDYYILAHWSSFSRIDKDTLEWSYDVEDC